MFQAGHGHAPLQHRASPSCCHISIRRRCCHERAVENVQRSLPPIQISFLNVCAIGDLPSKYTSKKSPSLSRLLIKDFFPVAVWGGRSSQRAWHSEKECNKGPHSGVQLVIKGPFWRRKGELQWMMGRGNNSSGIATRPRNSARSGQFCWPLPSLLHLLFSVKRWGLYIAYIHLPYSGQRFPP